MVSAINDALFEISEPITFVALVLASPSSLAPDFLLLFAGESECSLVSESETRNTLNHIA